MAENTETNVESGSEEETQSSTPPPDLNKLVEEKVNENLKPIKEKLDNAYKLRDEAMKKVAEFERKEREAELARLEEQGKFKEAYEKRLAEIQAKAEVLQKRNIELTRDVQVRNHLAALDFRSEKTLKVAEREIVEQLVQNEVGEWVHKSGVPIQDFVRSFIADETNSFLFKPKVSTGAGGSGPTNTTNVASGKRVSLFDMTQDEVLQMAMEGKLP
jgi:polyribonucleotide nucleotidyltransferase